MQYIIKQKYCKGKEILNQIKTVNQNRYQYYSKDINEEYKDENISKYEYWQDSPFRTIKPKASTITNEEASFLDFLYKENQ